jgi:Flp pilus assembly protein TadD
VFTLEHPYERRSTRVPEFVLLTVTGTDESGQPFTEQAGTLEVSLHGFKYFSKYALSIDSWLSVEIPATRDSGKSTPHRFEGRVCWVSKSKNMTGLFQVGVAFELAGNIWNLAHPPEDWGQIEAACTPDTAIFEREMKELLALTETGTYYQLLRTTSESSRAQIRQKYYELARKFHPDHHMDHMEWMQPLHKIVETLALAYKTLTDETARQKYDERLVASGAFTLGQHQSEVQKTAEQCLEKARENFRAQNPGGAILWLRKAIEIEPESARYHALLGRVLATVAVFRREAIEELTKALQLDPLDIKSHMQLAALYEEAKLPWRARTHYEKVLEIDADNIKAQERLDLLDAESGKTGKRSLFNRIFSSSR